MSRDAPEAASQSDTSALSAANLAAAVAAGIVTAQQAEQLRALAARSAAAKATAELPTATPPLSSEPALSASERDDDERFVMFNGFNDVFLALGVVLVLVALIGNTLFVAPVTWALSELLVRRRRAVLPGVVLAIAFAWSCGTLAYAAADRGLAFPVGAGLAALAYYARFKLPFALLIVAVSIAAAFISAYGMTIDFVWPSDGSLLTATRPLSVPSLIAGLSIFALAMWFDGSDPERRTRRSDCGFWLHMAAAPLIVHPLIAPLWSAIRGSQFDPLLPVGILAIVSALAAVALVIDRRALLVASLVYMTGAIGYLLRYSGGGDYGWNVTTSFAVVGAFVLLLGLGWRPLRRRLLGLISSHPLLSHVPPVHS